MFSKFWLIKLVYIGYCVLYTRHSSGLRRIQSLIKGLRFYQFCIYLYKLIFLVLTFFLETVDLYNQYHKLKASNIFHFISFSLLISALSLGTSKFYNLIKIKSKIYPLFRYPIIIMYNFYINMYGQGFGILFRSVIFLVCFSNLKSVLCYEIFKKWPLLSLFPDCIRRHILIFTQ
jgi:hypothetical protein